MRHSAQPCARVRLSGYFAAVTKLEVFGTLCLLAIASAAYLTVALLERCEKHLRALHVDVLGPLDDRSAEGMAARRQELGLDDGYPYRQTTQFGLGLLVGGLVYLFFGS
jgi:hypothetical protein